MKNITINPQNGINSIEINTQSLAAGMYILQLDQEDLSISRKTILK